MNPIELQINRRSTAEFINGDPITVALRPMVETKTPGGGIKREPGVPRIPQRLRLIPQTDVMPSVQTPDGIQLTPTFVLMGQHDATMARWDTFELNGNKYQITSPIRPEHSVESRYFTKADVARF